MSAWDNLSVKEKADIMKVAISNGITNLSDIKQRYNEFAEGGDIEPEKYYAIMERVAEENNAEWNRDRIKEGERPLTVDEDFVRILNDNAYDYKGYYSKYPNGNGNAINHWTDEFKTVYHPTFSDESKYSGKKSQYNPDGLPGGFWAGESFIPRVWQVDESNRFDTGGPKQNFFIEVPSSTYVNKPSPLEILINGNSPENALKRTNRVYSNYSEAKDNPLTPLQEVSRNTLRWLQDKRLNPFGSGVSNCTLTATQWVDPNNPIKNASSIYNSPELYNYVQIDEKDAIPGDIVIAKDPNKESYHTMLINGFAKGDGVYNFDGNDFSYKKGEPLMTYSKGGHDASFIRRDVPLSIYTANSDGHTSNTFYRYDYPNSVTLPEVVITPKALGGNLFAKGGIHIKPSHRGRLTKLKARTGKTEAELYNDGNPAHKKMVVFARNARKWHDLGGTLYPDGGSMNPSVGKAMQYFMNKGLTDYQAAGIVGNLMRESSLDHKAVNKDSQAYGLAQWLGDRKTNLFKRYGNNPTFEQQLDYVWDELNSTHKRGLKMLKASKSAEEAARNAMGYYEFSAGPEKAIANMIKHGQDGEGSMRKGVNFAMDILGQNSVEYVPQMQLPPNYNVLQNWELPAPQYTLDELAASGTIMSAKELPLTTRIPSSGERPNALLDLLAQYQYLDSMLSQ